jgi:hypothetical protein
MEDIIMTESKFIFADFLEQTLKCDDTFVTYGLMFECCISEEGRQNLCEKPISEKRNGVTGISDELLLNQSTFYAIGAFLKLLKELNFDVQETKDTESDFVGTLFKDPLQIDVEFNYGEKEIDYKVIFRDDREHSGHKSTKEFLERILNGGWNLPTIEGLIKPSSLYDDLETFLRDFRLLWVKYQSVLKEKV